MKIYFAGPLFSEAETAFNLCLARKLEELGYQVFLPQRDGVESAKSPYKEMTREDRRKAMFAMDRAEIFNSDVFLFILDGRVPDEGACVELGMAHTSKLNGGSPQSIIGLQTDVRAAFMGAKLNPMVALCFDKIFTDAEELLQFLKHE